MMQQNRDSFDSCDSFEEQVTALTETLYCVSATLLPRACDRQDAVQSCILSAWKHQHRVRDPQAFRA